MSDEQFEFVMAIDEYKRANARPFPTWTEVLEVIRALGYRRVAEPQALAPHGSASRHGLRTRADRGDSENRSSPSNHRFFLADSRRPIVVSLRGGISPSCPPAFPRSPRTPCSLP